MTAQGKFLPPNNFTPAGEICRAWPTVTPAFVRRRAQEQSSRAKNAGLKYEQNVQEWMEENIHAPENGIAYLPNLWFCFEDTRGNRRWCQPDGILIDLPRRRVTIVEIKITHTVLAWWQVRKLYQPIVRMFFDEQTWPEVQGLEICRKYEMMEFPERFHFLGEPLEVRENSFGVMKLRM